MKYDVVVVGAGPAGSTAAKYLAEKGVKVLLIDKSKFPRDKPCGGGLPVRALDRFPYIKDTDLIESYSYGGFAYYSMLMYKGELYRDEPIFAMVRREKFDYGLVKLAIKSGAKFLDGKSVENVILTEDKATIFLDDRTRIDTEIVIGADGVWSIIAKKSGLCHSKRPVSVCVFQEYSLSSTELDRLYTEKRLCHIFIRFQEMVGYAWVFPKKNHVNIGIDEVRIEKTRSKRKINLKEAYKEYFNILKENKIIPGDLKIGEIRGAALPISPLDRTYKDRILICGDAGGFINPITGEGLYYAMVSGKLAADICAQSLEASDTSARFLSRYETLWKQDFGNDLKLFIRANNRWAGHVRKSFRLVLSDRMLSEMILDVATGQRSVKEYRWKLIRRFLYVYLKDLISIRK